jgi:hypothetical protein
MNKRKSLKELSWDVDELTYRSNNALSHSLLSAYARGGHKALREIYYERKKLSTTALSFGSLLDTIITNPGEFDNLYLVVDIEIPSGKMQEVVDRLFEMYPEISTLVSVPYDDILKVYNQSFDNNWKPDTKVNKVIEEGNGYFKLLALKGDRTLVTKNDYLNALECKEALYANCHTGFIFPDRIRDMEVFYQLKFKINMDGDDPLAWQKELIEGDTYRVMFDIIAVDHAKKTIYPVDLKTTSKDEEAFDESITEYRYDIQANSYRDVLIKVLSTTDDYKDYYVEDFYFVCINRTHRKPVVWRFPRVEGEVMTTPKNVILRDCDWRKLYAKVNKELETGDPDYSVETLQNNMKVCRFVVV